MIQKPEILDVFSREGIETDLHGRFICPFHADRSPSGKVYTLSGRWKCYGCGAGGDVVDLVRLLHGFTYGEALRHLGIDGPRTPEAIRQEREARRRRERREKYRASLRRLTNRLSDELRELYQIKDAWKDYDTDDETRASWAVTVADIPLLEYRLDVLINGEEQDRFDVYKEGENGNKK